MLKIILKNSIFELEQQVAGRITWDSTQSQSPTGQLKVKFGWRIEGKGSGKRETIDTLDFGKLSIDYHIPFQFKIPRDAPVSFDGKLFRIIWEVGAKLHIGIFQNHKQTALIQVVPRQVGVRG